MKYLISIFFSLFVYLNNYVLAVDCSYEGNFVSEFKKMETPNNKKYNILLNQRAWRDSLGDIGTAFCYGKVETLITEKFNLEVIYENKNKKNEKFWMFFLEKKVVKEEVWEKVSLLMALEGIKI